MPPEVPSTPQSKKKRERNREREKKNKREQTHKKIYLLHQKRARTQQKG